MITRSISKIKDYCLDASLQKITSLFILLGIASLIYWPRVHYEEFILPFRYEFLFSIAVLLSGLNLTQQWLNKKISYKQLSKDELEIYFLLFAFIGSVLLGTLISFFRYDIGFNTAGMIILYKHFLGVAIFIIIYRSTKANPKLYKFFSWAFIYPSLIFIPFLFFPDLAEQLGFISDGYRFQGATTNPSTMDLLNIIVFSYCWSLFLYLLIKKEKTFLIILYFLFSVGISSLIFWSQSRSYIVMMFWVIIFIHLYYGIFFKLTAFKIIAYLLLGALLITSSFLLIPTKAKDILIFGRIFGETNLNFDYRSSQPQIKQPHKIAAIQRFFTGLSHKKPENRVILKQKINKLVIQDPRIAMWKHYLPLALSNPLGLGVNYLPRFGYQWADISPFVANGINLLPPVFIMNLWAYGGIMAMILMCLLLKKAVFKYKNNFQQIRLEPNDLPYKVGVIAALLALWASSIFVGLAIDYLGFWILFALALV